MLLNNLYNYNISHYVSPMVSSLLKYYQIILLDYNIIILQANCLIKLQLLKSCILIGLPLNVSKNGKNV